MRTLIHKIPDVRRHTWFIFLVVALAVVAGAPVCGSPAPQPTPEPKTSTMVALTTAEQSATAGPSLTVVPTATPVEQATGTPELAHLPTPSSPSDAMTIGGTLWVDARPAFGEVLALINGQQCGRGQSTALPDGDGVPYFVVQIASDAQQAGCGTPGADVTITINGRAMNNAIPWQAGFQQPTNLIAGPAFAQYYGVLQADDATVPFDVVAYVGDVVCGQDRVSRVFLDALLRYHVTVDPDQLRPGCGKGGVEVTLRVRAEGQPDFVLGTALWMADAAAQRPTADLTGRFNKTPLATAAAAQ